MTPLVIVLTLCSVATGGCTDHRIPFFGSELQCLARAQAEIITHVREGQTVERFGCTKETTP
jgi:hypothetical protein